MGFFSKPVEDSQRSGGIVVEGLGFRFRYILHIPITMIRLTITRFISIIVIGILVNLSIVYD